MKINLLFVMPDKIKVPLDKFAKIVGIKYESEDTNDEASDYCSSVEAYSDEPLSEEEFSNCENRYVKIVKNAIIDASKSSFEAVDLDIELDEDKDEVIITPQEDWEDTAKKIAVIVDGYMGIMWSPTQTMFETFKEINEPSTDKELVERHLSWVKNYADLFGVGKSPNQEYDDILEEDFGYFF